MNEMIKKVRGDKKGFTLAELLIVVAIILILVAIAIPVFIGAQNQAIVSVAQADQRAAKSQAAATYLMKGETASPLTYTAKVGSTGDLTVTKDPTPGTATPLGDDKFADGTITKMVRDKDKATPKGEITFIVEIKADDIAKK